jgi:hypothetical protein
VRTLAILLALTSAADAHCFRRWAYPYPQPGCGIYARVSSRPRFVRPAPAPVEDRSWYVEIAPLSPDDEARQKAIEQLKEKLR